MFEDWMAALGATEIDEASPAELTRLARDAAALRAALDGFDARLATAMADGDGHGGAARLRGATRCTQREADQAVERGRLAQVLPEIGDALASGEISAGHVDVLARAAARTSPEVVQEAGLIDVARRKPADAMRREVGRAVKAARSAEQEAAWFRQARAARRCVIFDDKTTGMTVLHAELDPEAGARVSAALADATEVLFAADGGRDGARNVRRPDQRRADALELLLAGGSARTDGVPAVRTQMMLIVQADGSAVIPGGGRLPAEVVERLACGSDLYGLVLSADGDPLWLGRRRRLASDGQWRALIARDGGCVGCDADPSRCEAHHVEWHRDGGPTDIDNLVLLCRHHHHLVHEQGWQVTRDLDGAWTLVPP